MSSKANASPALVRGDTPIQWPLTSRDVLTYVMAFAEFLHSRADCLSKGLSMENLPLKPGYWRHSNKTLDIKRCVRSVEGVTPCIGGIKGDYIGSSLCVAGTTGPLCQQCTMDGKYFDKALAVCLKCPDAPARIGILFAITLGVLMVLVLAHRLLHQQRARSILNRTVMGQQIFSSIFKNEALGLKAKLKVSRQGYPMRPVRPSNIVSPLNV